VDSSSRPPPIWLRQQGADHLLFGGELWTLAGFHLRWSPSEKSYGFPCEAGFRLSNR
ncbi:hypothetical protein TorRG33x02_345600, partial [Trema orientale]